MSRLLLTAAASMLSVASPCLAGFTGFSVEYRGNIDNRNVYQVFANFDASTYIVLNVLNHIVQSGAMNALHNDLNMEDDAPGTWSPSLTWNAQQRANDSFVTITGLTGSNAQTNLDPSFGAGFGPEIPFRGGWFHSGNPVGVSMGAGNRIRIMQVALAIGDPGYTASAQVGYKVSAASTDPVFGSGSYTIPAPATLLALVGVCLPSHRRRRQ